ncbi:MAG: hypothetical protein IPI83_15225 [Sphingomonadales bacterium]|nr:hypothetical protein [Sphingomonadales bacterium]
MQVRPAKMSSTITHRARRNPGATLRLVLSRGAGGGASGGASACVSVTIGIVAALLHWIAWMDCHSVALKVVWEARPGCLAWLDWCPFAARGVFEMMIDIVLGGQGDRVGALLPDCPG